MERNQTAEDCICIFIVLEFINKRFIMSEYNIQAEDNKRKTNPSSRADKLKEIDGLYRAQIKQIYTESKDKI